MVMQRLILVITLFIFSAGVLSAGENNKNAENKIKNYFKDVMVKVTNEKDFTKKREILNSSLEKMDKVLSTVASYSDNDNELSALNKMRAEVKNKLDELNGKNGFDKVQDSELNNFSTYVMQNFETADTYLYVSVTALLIIALLLILLL